MSKINQSLDNQQRSVKAIFLSSYIPRKCGIASFTHDLTQAINALNPECLVDIIAVDPGDQDYTYPPEVKFRINKNTRQDYIEAAHFINNSDYEIVCLQHEFGLFGGEEKDTPLGTYILDFLRELRKPVVTTCHTIISDPGSAYTSTALAIAGLSTILVAMVPDAQNRVEQGYGMSADRVVVIHHGVPDQPKATKKYKKTLGWENRKVLLMTGLLGRNKGIEYVIQALPEVVKQFPETLFVIAGQTHPEVIKWEGEAYRESLMELARSLGVEQHLEFINRYLSLEELLQLFEACDIYLTPHTDPQQVTSGTLAYALGMGKACISTKYIYAKEMLSNERGILVDFKNVPQITQGILQVFSNPLFQKELEQRAYVLGKTMSWPRIAERYLNLFRTILHFNEILNS